MGSDKNAYWYYADILPFDIRTAIVNIKNVTAIEIHEIIDGGRSKNYFVKVKSEDIENYYDTIPVERKHYNEFFSKILDKTKKV